MNNLNLLFALGSSILAVGIFVIFTLILFWHFRQKGRFVPFAEGMLRPPGGKLRKDFHEAATDYLVFCAYLMGAAMIVGCGLFLVEDRFRSQCVATGAICMLLCLYKLYKLFSQIQNLKLGADGEEYTGQELNLLMLDGAMVYHDIPYQYGNIDHVVVGHDKAFTVETKSVRKPRNPKGSESSRQSIVKFTGERIIFPHFEASNDMLDQAKRHAKFLSDAISKNCGIAFPVVPIVALPGWKIENLSGSTTGVRVINPKRGMFLKSVLGRKSSEGNRQKVVSYLDTIARTENLRTHRTNADANKHYDFFLNQRVNGDKSFGEN